MAGAGAYRGHVRRRVGAPGDRRRAARHRLRAAAADRRRGVPGRPVRRALDPRAAPQHAAAGDRRRGHLRRGVRVGLDGRRHGRDGPVLRRGSARRGRRVLALAASRPTGSGAASSTAWNHRPSCSWRSGEAGRRPRRTPSSPPRRHRPSSSPGPPSGSRSCWAWPSCRWPGATCSEPLRPSSAHLDPAGGALLSVPIARHPWGGCRRAWNGAKGCDH